MALETPGELTVAEAQATRDQQPIALLRIPVTKGGVQRKWANKLEGAYEFL